MTLGRLDQGTHSADQQKEKEKKKATPKLSEDVSIDEPEDRKAPVISRKFAKFRSPIMRSE